MHGRFRLIMRWRRDGLSRRDISVFALLLVLALAFADRTDGVSRVNATQVVSGVTNYRTAIL